MASDNIWSLEDIMNGKVEPEPPKQPERYEHAWTPAEDEAFRRGAYKRSWENTSRRDWNSNPIHSDGVMCHVCGYKWHHSNIEQDGSCFNCWMIDNKPDEVKRIWANFDANSGGVKKHGMTALPKLVKLG